MTFDHAIRVFLCDGEFRLPGESQKIDRLLDIFCVTYCEHNPRVFVNAQAALVVAFAMIMLNTDLHDTRLRSGRTTRKPMTLEAFKSNLRGLNHGKNFDPDFLEGMYSNIAKREIRWKDEDARFGGTGKASSLTESKARAVLARRSHATLQQLLRKPVDPWESPAFSEDIRAAVFETILEHFTRLLSEVGLQTIDTHLLEVCISGAQMCASHITGFGGQVGKVRILLRRDVV